MIVAFVLDPSALGVDGAQEDAARDIATHGTVIDLWRSIGVLLSDNDGADSDLFRAVEELPQALRTRWEKALLNQKIVPRPVEWCGPASLCDPDQLTPLMGTADVIVVEPARASQLGVGAGEACCSCPSGIEITRFDCASESQRFKQALKLREQPIAGDTKTASIWKNRFQRLAQMSKNVVVVDRYAIVNLKDKGDRSGVLTLVNKLKRDAPNEAKLTVYASVVKEEVKDLETALAPVLAQVGKDIREIEVFLLEDRVFARLAHGRYIRFENFVCEIDTGLEVLAGAKTYRSAQFTMKSSGSQRKLEEQKLRASAIVRRVSAADVSL